MYNKPLVTRKGYVLFEVISALQKDIRRSNTRGALFWAGEMSMSGFDSHLWNRLLIIGAEDIGVADKEAVMFVNSLHTAFFHLKSTTKKISFMHISSAVVALAQANKSRMTDWAKIYMVKNGDKFPIPDYALDIHTQRGRKMGRDYVHFIEVGQHLEDEKHVKDEEFYKEFFEQYLNDYQNKVVTEDGYFVPESNKVSEGKGNTVETNAPKAVQKPLI